MMGLWFNPNYKEEKEKELSELTYEEAISNYSLPKNGIKEMKEIGLPKGIVEDMGNTIEGILPNIIIQSKDLEWISTIIERKVLSHDIIKAILENKNISSTETYYKFWHTLFQAIKKCKEENKYVSFDNDWVINRSKESLSSERIIKIILKEESLDGAAKVEALKGYLKNTKDIHLDRELLKEAEVYDIYQQEMVDCEALEKEIYESKDPKALELLALKSTDEEKLFELLNNGRKETRLNSLKALVGRKPIKELIKDERVTKLKGDRTYEVKLYLFWMGVNFSEEEIRKLLKDTFISSEEYKKLEEAREFSAKEKAEYRMYILPRYLNKANWDVVIPKDIARDFLITLSRMNESFRQRGFRKNTIEAVIEALPIDSPILRKLWEVPPEFVDVYKSKESILSRMSEEQRAIYSIRT